MITSLHTTFRRLLVEYGEIDADEVDITFERPTRQWADSLMRPAVNVYLFDLAENTERRIGGAQMSRMDHRASFRVPPRFFDLHYLVGAFATEPADEQILLWRVLATLLRHAPLPAALLPEWIAALDQQVSTTVAQPDSAGNMRPFEMWSAYDITPRPALIYTVTAPLDPAHEFSSPLVLSRSLRFKRTNGIAAPEDMPVRIGGIVRTAQGAPVAGARLSVEGTAQEVITDEQGRYSVRIIRPGHYILHVEAPGMASQSAELAIPSATYDIVVVQA